MPRIRYDAPPSSEEEDEVPRETRANLIATTVGTSLAGRTTRKSELLSVLTSPQKSGRRHIPIPLREEAEGGGEQEDEVDPMMVHLLDEDGEVPPDSGSEEGEKEAIEPRKQRASVSNASGDLIRIRTNFA
jgi:hypothetical protein